MTILCFFVGHNYERVQTILGTLLVCSKCGKTKRIYAR